MWNDEILTRPNGELLQSADRMFTIPMNDLTLSEGDDDKAPTFQGYASIFDVVDAHEEIIKPGAFTKTLKEQKNVMVMWNHDRFAGISLSHVEDKKGLVVEGEMNIGTEGGREALAMMKQMQANGNKMGLSIGGRIIKANFPDDHKEPIELLEIRLMEYSLTPWPANPRTWAGKLKSDEHDYVSTHFPVHGALDDDVEPPVVDEPLDLKALTEAMNGATEVITDLTFRRTLYVARNHTT